MKHQHLRNNMHTSTLALSVVALILFFLPGCGKGEIPGDKVLTATIIDGEETTRTAVIDQPSIKAEVRWEVNDRIGVFGKGGGNNLLFTAGVDDILENGKKARFRTTGSMPTGEVTAYYPYQEGASIGNNRELTL